MNVLNEEFFERLKVHYYYVDLIPKNQLTPDLCKKMVKINGLALQHIPAKFRTQELCCIALGVEKITKEECVAAISNGKPLSLIPKKFLDLEMVKTSLERFQNLNAIPTEFRTAEICSLAVEKKGRNIEFVPEEHLTEEMCIYAAKTAKQQGNDTFEILSIIPKNFRTLKVCLKAIKYHDINWTSIPRELQQDPKIIEAFKQRCIRSVQKDSFNIARVPPAFLDEAMCLDAVQQAGDVLPYIPVQFRSAAACLAAVEADGEMLKHVPKPLKTKELCLVALEQNARALAFIPASFLTPKLCLGAVKRCGDVLEFVPVKFRDEKICRKAVKREGSILAFVPQELRTKEMCERALHSYAGALAFVPDHLKTQAMCDEAVNESSNGSCIEFVPEHFLTDELCLAAIEKGGANLEKIPEHRRTDEMYVNSIKKKDEWDTWYLISSAKIIPEKYLQD